MSRHLASGGRGDRSTSLDVLRGVAILLVLGRHATRGTSMPVDAPLMLRWWFEAGWVGVDLFFVLSGFLIGGALLRELGATGAIRPLRFLIRRGFRIYPPFLLLLALTVMAGHGQSYTVTRSRLLTEAFFLQDYVPYNARLWAHTWSLAVEEQFYLLAPVALTLVGRLGPPASLMRRVLIGAGIVGAVALSLRVAMIGTPYQVETHLFPAHLRMDALAFGVAAAALVSGYPQWTRAAVQRAAQVVAVSAVAVLLILAQTGDANRAVNTIGLSAIALVAAGLVLIAHHAAGSWRWLGPIATVGRASYSIYLFHIGVRMMLEGAIGTGVATTWQGFVLYAACAVGVGLALHYVVEIPCLRLRDRLVPGPAARMAPVKALAA